ncbi:helix-turn-helix transcriptional regulator [Allomesorhizobium camelthorni]|uniref:Response regulator transcription factor n=1 Tax=Allomesorhizobium camelthorni TaxID=475069 RepID=A0A6G4W9B5_9HYPH|nr:LuxR C-terminal-related transcriptional regulator [Mesorhizobium camelthorni]NGO51362.1 response regulator transcription factor [Mesorhizobium camelthorni]
MRHVFSNVIADLIELLPNSERQLLRRLCETVESGGEAAMTVSRRECTAAARLASRLPSAVRWQAGELNLVSRDAANLLRAAARDSATTTLDNSAADPVVEIRAKQDRGDFERAISLFRENGGVYFIHYHGNDACLDILNRFPQEVVDAEEMLTLALAMHALKAGNVTHARFLIVRRFGDDMLSLETVIRGRARYSLAVRQFRFLMAIYEDHTVSNELRTLLFDMLAEFPIDDHLHRGGFYNSMLAVCLQRRELNEAEEIAKRAHHHYREAEAHLLVFYIELHRVVFSLRRGMLGEADRWVSQARDALGRVRFDTPTDQRLLNLLEGVVAYENGEPEHLVRFVAEEFDKFAYGEIWPTVVELALVYCSRVVSRQVGLGAAISFLDKWRVQEWRSRRFNLAITMREIEILQTANRWQSASDRLMTVQSRINLTWVESAEEALARLVDPIEIELAMAWLRLLIQHQPRRPILRDQVEMLLRNENIGERERGRLRLWAAYLARTHRDVTRARHLFSELLEDIARIGIITHLLGDIGLVDALLDDKRIAAHVLSSPDRRATVRKLHTFTQRRETERTPLTRQELRVLRLVAEGATNKFVARQFRLSEVTVKFHLTNIYRKMGCRKRAEAVASARALGWL